ncbi:hypothetical protein MRX96_022046 [Rhipicephalus microplus]
MKAQLRPSKWNKLIPRRCHGRFGVGIGFSGSERKARVSLSRLSHNVLDMLVAMGPPNALVGALLTAADTLMCFVQYCEIALALSWQDHNVVIQ